ncbi:DUF2484 family protein [Jannaschia ovalis]|uniref:DUF2484 family protein n=1 Tax=Jannaschia ovalis TaxID=3038773 RepID=A0ABY8LCH8_9RHOB|nr:DUF2484 family protein [Jannaschia sp. GRR-S6-38]WGH79031.1 DUF2484 family protein [Jannaschia sp. GRR-S6-38]
MALVGLCLWVVLAAGLQAVLTARQSWPAAYGLMALGAPLLVWLWLSAGPGWAALGLAAMALILRWPLRYFGRWLTRMIR